MTSAPTATAACGCENPLKYGEVLLGLALPNEHYTAERLQKMFGGSEININFPTGIPDHLTYQTAFVDDAGKLQIRDDVYGRDARLLAILKGSERKVADIADRPAEGQFSSAPVKMPPGTFGSAAAAFGGGRRSSSGCSAAARSRRPSRAPASAPARAPGHTRANAAQLRKRFLGNRPQPIAAAERVFRAHVQPAHARGCYAWCRIGDRSAGGAWPRSRPPSTATKRRW